MSETIIETAETASLSSSKSEARTAAMRRSNRLAKVRLGAIQIALLAVVLIIWEAASGTLINELMISKPSSFFPVFWDWVLDGTLLENAGITFGTAIVGLACGVAAGLTVGIVLGQSKVLSDILEPFITAIYTLPNFALIPLFIMWVGIGPKLGILTAAVIVFFLVFFNTFYGIRDVRRSLINSMLVMGGSKTDVLLRVRLPSALIWVVAAFKLAVPQAIVGVVVAEMLAGNSGLGYLVSLNAGMFNAAGTFAGLLALLIAGYLIYRLMDWAVKKPLQWKEAGGAM